jgi:uncharacterized protein
MKNKANTREDLIQRLLDHREQLSSFGVTSIGLFGSFERGEQTASSDIDLLVEFTPEKHTFDIFMDVTFFLEDILGRRVEVVTLEGLSPHIGPHILQEVEHVPVAA